MRWLNRRFRSERGASAVLVGLLMVLLLGFLAFSIDVGVMYAERAQLQNGADAASLAIAYDCADGTCTDPVGRAASYTSDNANDAAANVAYDLRTDLKKVTVTASTLTANGENALQHYFAALLPGGPTESTVRARATAEWGGPGSGTVLALALSWCEFQESLGAEGAHMTVRTDTNKTCKKSPSEEVIPGGFGWLDNTTAPCEATINLSLNLNAAGELWAGSDAGGDVPNDCRAKLSSLKGTNALIPIYDRVRGTGSNAEYRIFAFASFTITGWNFPSTSDIDSLAPLCPPSPPADAKDCKKGNNWRGIQGVFMKMVSVDSAFGLGGPTLNAPIVVLTK